MVCRLNRRRTWTCRIAMESLAHETSAYVTLTYSDESVPLSPSGSSTLRSEHWREFTKGIGYRYFGCGEYGEKFGRPHYHVILFGIDPFAADALARSRWRYGFVQTSPDAPGQAAMAYVAAYTVKKMTRKDSEAQKEFLGDREPEFARMSRRPAIGWPGVQFIVRWLPSPEGVRYLRTYRDVPNAATIGGRTYPLGRTLVSKLRELADVDSDDPLRREAREGMLRAVNLDPIAKAERERLRYGRYDVLKARSRVRAGSL